MSIDIGTCDNKLHRVFGGKQHDEPYEHERSEACLRWKKTRRLEDIGRGEPGRKFAGQPSWNHDLLVSRVTVFFSPSMYDPAHMIWWSTSELNGVSSAGTRLVRLAIRFLCWAINREARTNKETWALKQKAVAGLESGYGIAGRPASTFTVRSDRNEANAPSENLRALLDEESPVRRPIMLRGAGDEPRIRELHPDFYKVQGDGDGAA